VASNAEEEFVLTFMMMPYERALKLDKFDFLSVELADDLGTPVLRYESKFLSEVHFQHCDS
jgi:hypothetical protein